MRDERREDHKVKKSQKKNREEVEAEPFDDGRRVDRLTPFPCAKDENAPHIGLKNFPNPKISSETMDPLF